MTMHTCTCTGHPDYICAGKCLILADYGGIEYSCKSNPELNWLELIISRLWRYRVLYSLSDAGE